MMRTFNSLGQNLHKGPAKIKPDWYLLVGVITMTASHLTFSIDAVAWVSMVPLLIFLSITKGWKSRLLFTIALIFTWSIITYKIITPPIPIFLVFLYSIPISLFHLPGYLLWAKYKHRKYSLFIFPASIVIMEWLQYTFTPLASWGVAAYTQSESLGIMQVTSLFGLAGLSFLIYWVNVAIATIIVKGKTSLITFQVPIAIVIVVILYGSLRLDLSRSNGKETISMAAIGTDSEIGAAQLPTKKENERDINEIFKRTEKAAQLGAQIAVWNEAAFFLEPDIEGAWIDSIKYLASLNNITLVASYILMTSESPLRYENKYLLIDTMGQLVHSYLKHEPVPGEPAIKGREELIITTIEGTNLGGAICYDYDFPYLAKEYGKIGADIIALPSSDWRGIDPLHTRMAAFRAVEQGHSILRSTRFGLSAAITPYGEMTAQMSSFDTNDKVMMSHLPLKKVNTLYSFMGDLFVYLCTVPLILPFLLNDGKGHWFINKTSFPI